MTTYIDGSTVYILRMVLDTENVKKPGNVPI